MDTHALRRAYADFLHSARHKPLGPADHPGWSAEMVLAHIIVSDRLIAQAAARSMAGMPAAFDNLASQSEPYLQAILEAAGSWDALLQEVEHTGNELIALTQRMTDQQAATPIAATITSDNTVVLDRTIPLAALVQVPAQAHLGMHKQQLHDLAAAADHVHSTT
jgi:hypothetical protein